MSPFRIGISVRGVCLQRHEALDRPEMNPTMFPCLGAGLRRKAAGDISGPEILDPPQPQGFVPEGTILL